MLHGIGQDAWQAIKFLRTLSCQDSIRWCQYYSGHGMNGELRFRVWLPVVQASLAALSGGIGLWQRYAILKRSFLGWNSTARFHVWPWPLKFAAILNVPALLAGSLVSLPLQLAWPEVPEYVYWLLCLFFVPLIWYGLGSRIDRCWQLGEKVAWAVFSALFLLSLIGAFLPMGYTGFLPYGFVVWVAAAYVMLRFTRSRFRLPIKRQV